MAAKLIHITDLYHPHNDPDDHYDLAEIFALVKTGDIDLLEVIIDHPKEGDKWSPALASVYQLNALAEANVHVTLGADTRSFAGRPELWKTASSKQVRGAESILDHLRRSAEKVYLHIAGGCLDTAIALAREPEVFREKCAGIYLNAGSAIPTVEKEWNVLLGKTEYAALFDAPCPVYWNPCMHSMNQWSGAYGTHYGFYQKKVWAGLSDGLKNYFLYALTHSTDLLYLNYLKKVPDAEALAAFGEGWRDMYCTAAILDIAGKTVAQDGEVMEKGKCTAPAFRFRPISVHPTPEGDTIWEPTEESVPERYGFQILLPEENQAARYDEEMTKALGSVLSVL